MTGNNILESNLKGFPEENVYPRSQIRNLENWKVGMWKVGMWKVGNEIK